MARPQDTPNSIPSFSPRALTVLLLSLLFTGRIASAQDCILLRGSSTCPAFDRASVSTNAQLRGYFSFLANVSSVETFDRELSNYVRSGYVATRYRDTFGCTAIDLNQTSSLYARYTTSFICNAIVQNSIQPCGLAANDSRPLCADTCALFATSEERIVNSPELCGTPRTNVESLLYADYTNCGLPRDSIDPQCISGATNEPTECGFQYNLGGLCAYCASSRLNSTNSCCVTAKAESRCQNVHLPLVNSMTPLFTTAVSSTHSAAASSTATALASVSGTSNGLSGGAIAGIVIGSVAAAALLLALLLIGCLYARRHRSPASGVFLNQPTPPRSGGAAGGVTSSRSMDEKFAPVPGARVTRMTALERPSDNSTPKGYDGSPGSSRERAAVVPAAPATLLSATAAGGIATGGTLSPHSRGDRSGWRTPAEGRDPTLPSSPDSFNTADGSPGQSEQLDAFKDYYSEDDIHPGDLVSTLWAYQPRAGDEFTLERGDMLRIIGIWDDGWATAIRVNMRAEDWSPERNTQRDSGFSTQDHPADSPPTNGPVKAFPLVCVCLPQHWVKIVENETEDPGEPNPRRQ